MARCPICHDEYEAGVTHCADCRVELVAGDGPLPPRVDALLGTFHPLVAARVVALLEQRRIAHDVVPMGVRCEVVVDRAWRDDLRAELAVNWSTLLAGFDQDQRQVLIATGGPQPGWYDAPQGAWIDRQGRIKVEADQDELLEEDARRTVGPTLLVIGTILGLFGWYADAGALTVVIGLGMVGLGLFLPR